MNYNKDFRYDLAIELLCKKVEVKLDFKCLETGNIFVEYYSRGKKSGLSTTEAEYWCYWLSDYHCILIKTDKLKEMCRKYLNTDRDRNGGDMNTSKGILLPIK